MGTNRSNCMMQKQWPNTLNGANICKLNTSNHHVLNHEDDDEHYQSPHTFNTSNSFRNNSITFTKSMEHRRCTTPESGCMDISTARSVIIGCTTWIGNEMASKGTRKLDTSNMNVIVDRVLSCVYLESTNQCPFAWLQASNMKLVV
eukprot:864289_1